MRIQNRCGCSRDPVPRRRARRRRVRTLDQGAGQRLFVGVARCEVDVSAFRRAGHQPPIDPRQQSNAEAGARGDQRDVALSVGVSLVEHLDFVSPENRHRPCERFEIVQQVGARNGHFTSQRVEVDDPWHVRQLRARTGDRARDAEASSVDVGWVRRRLAKELQTQRAEIGEVERAVGARFDGMGRRSLRETGREKFSFRQRRPRAASLTIVRRQCLTSTRRYCIFLASARVMQAGYGERAGARHAAQRRGPTMTPQSPDLPLADQLVVFTGKLSSLGPQGSAGAGDPAGRLRGRRSDGQDDDSSWLGRKRAPTQRKVRSSGKRKISASA